LAKKSQLVDPAGDLSRELSRTLADYREAIALEQPIFVDREKPKAIAKLAAGASYIVDVRTLGWGVAGTAVNRRDANYSAKLNVIDGRTGGVAVDSDCTWTAPALTNGRAAVRGQDAGEVARAQFVTAHEVCLGQFSIAIRSLFLSLGRPISSPAQSPNIAEAHAIETRVTPPTAVVMTTLPPSPLSAPVGPSSSQAAPLAMTDPRPTPSLASSLGARAERREQPHGPVPPTYAEYPYARPDEAPPSRTPPPEYRYAGRDANGYLVWPGKRP
jgi:hypothetical protein